MGSRLAGAELRASVLELEALVSRRAEHGIRGGEWSCASLGASPEPEAKKVCAPGLRAGTPCCRRTLTSEAGPLSHPHTAHPPQALMGAMLADVTSVLSRAIGGQRPLLMYGTLLGAVRDRDLMHWTADLDIGLERAQAHAQFRLGSAPPPCGQ